MSVMTPASQAAMTPAAALDRLKRGNARFVANRLAVRDLPDQVRRTAKGQYPFAVVLGCVDSRVAPELVFDQGIGDVFSVRVAGSVITPEVLGSMEFACRIAGAKLVVVLGHTQCGAIMGACDGVQLGHLTGLLARLQPALDATVTPPGTDRTSRNAAFVQQVLTRSVALAVEAVSRQSAVLRELSEQGAVGIIGAHYDVETGVVTFT